MQKVNLFWDKPIEYDNVTETHLQRADLCRKAVSEKRPFSEKELETVSDFFRTANTWASNAIEGSTFTIGETKTLLEYGVTIHGKSLVETLEICGHADAFDHMMSLAQGEDITIRDICDLHKKIYTKAAPETAGVYKTGQNFVSGSDYTTVTPENVNKEMSNLSYWMAENKEKLHPIIFAAEVHRKLAYIHPFADGNGRTARLAMNLLLIQNGYLPVSISPSLRLDYINSLESGRAGNFDSFYSFIAEAVTENTKDYMRALDIERPSLPKVPERDPFAPQMKAQTETRQKASDFLAEKVAEIDRSRASAEAGRLFGVLEEKMEIGQTIDMEIQGERYRVMKDLSQHVSTVKWNTEKGAFSLLPKNDAITAFAKGLGAVEAVIEEQIKGYAGKDGETKTEGKGKEEAER